MEEIAADFTYEAVRLSDRVLSWTWNRLYQGINVHNAERVRQLAQDGHEIVYVPATAATWTTCCSPMCSTTRAGAAAYRRRHQPELLAGRPHIPPAGRFLHPPDV